MLEKIEKETVKRRQQEYGSALKDEISFKERLKKHKSDMKKLN